MRRANEDAERAEREDRGVLPGELTPRMAKTLAGELVTARFGLRQPKSTRLRHRAVLRDQHGLVVAEGAVEQVEVDPHQVLEQALDGAVWGAEG